MNHPMGLAPTHYWSNPSNDDVFFGARPGLVLHRHNRTARAPAVDMGLDDTDEPHTSFTVTPKHCLNLRCFFTKRARGGWIVAVLGALCMGIWLTRAPGPRPIRYEDKLVLFREANWPHVKQLNMADYANSTHHFVLRMHADHAGKPLLAQWDHFTVIANGNPCVLSRTDRDQHTLHCDSGTVSAASASRFRITKPGALPGDPMHHGDPVLLLPDDGAAGTCGFIGTAFACAANRDAVRPVHFAVTK